MHMIFKKRISKGYKVTVSLLSVSALGINIISNFLYVLPDILVHGKSVFFFLFTNSICKYTDEKESPEMWGYSLCHILLSTFYF